MKKKLKKKTKSKHKSKGSMRKFAKLRKEKAIKKLQKETTFARIGNIAPAPDEPNLPDDIV
jgi:hypothetical protein